MVTQYSCRTCGCIQVEAKICKPLCNIRDFILIGVAHGDEDAALVGQLVACADQSFIERFPHGGCDAEHFTGGFHFRSELRVQSRQLFKGEDRYFDRGVGGNRGKTGAVRHIL